MDNLICSFPSCGARVVGRGLCAGHYNQQHRGKPLTPIRRNLTTEARFFAKVAVDQDCWRWVGAVGRWGYGNFNGGGTTYRAHRWAYEFLRAEIPEGLQLDHLCRNRWCVNPWHLEPVSPAVNTQRIPYEERGIVRPEACSAGHELTVENTYVQPKTGFRYCRTCQRRRSLDYVRRRRAERLASAAADANPPLK